MRTKTASKEAPAEPAHTHMGPFPAIPREHFGRDHERLLLYVESCCVDNRGRLDARRMSCNPAVSAVRHSGMSGQNWKHDYTTRLAVGHTAPIGARRLVRARRPRDGRARRLGRHGGESGALAHGRRQGACRCPAAPPGGSDEGVAMIVELPLPPGVSGEEVLRVVRSEGMTVVVVDPRSYSPIGWGTVLREIVRGIVHHIKPEFKEEIEDSIMLAFNQADMGTRREVPIPRPPKAEADA